ncbi:MarR family winged helix-turn-helix transcriptional regulator [Lactococcus fujiensis]|uniref:HTH marR-type domain-containing protein n=1 Tax=Lactococcus fujiensis JCM 16395 TaxID=1291764 RepID=A0A2A5RNH7_9LACT|nr:MarR family winged helix-turn-helix transcriptional regulator [Lactococcus fujiensis]PCS00894.1 hypothetical protein RT41_GL000684 [Lactococcus fujiensis JCM 16395]
MDYNQLAETFILAAKNPSKSRVVRRFNTYSHGEHQVIFYLFKNTGKPIVPSDIARYTTTSTARIATILNNLEDKKMITREISREDRRKILVGITDKGKKYAENAQSEFVGHIASILQAMGEEKAIPFVENFKLFLELGAELGEQIEVQDDTDESKN